MRVRAAGLVLLVLLSSTLPAEDALHYPFRITCEGLDAVVIEGVYNVDWGYGTLRSATGDFQAAFFMGSMIELLIPKDRPPGFRWLKEERYGDVTLRYGLNVRKKRIEATLLGADIDRRFNMAAAPAHEKRFIEIARTLATAQCVQRHLTSVPPSR